MEAIASFVRVIFTKPENELTAEEKAVRARLQAALNQVIERFHEETPGQDGLLAIELYPTDESVI